MRARRGQVRLLPGRPGGRRRGETGDPRAALRLRLPRPGPAGPPAPAATAARPPPAPAALARWRGFLRVLVARYGPHGSFWHGRSRRLPIRRWQIWNEPNFKLFWTPHIEPKGYARLLHASAVAIRKADPGAKIVLAGI